jgi:hypothetical protein
MNLSTPLIALAAVSASLAFAGSASADTTTLVTAKPAGGKARSATFRVKG